MLPKTIVTSEEIVAEYDVDLSDDVSPAICFDDSPKPFAIFQLSDGSRLEIHVPGASMVAIAGPSAATMPVFLCINTDGSIEESGALIFAGRSGQFTIPGAERSGEHRHGDE